MADYSATVMGGVIAKMNDLFDTSSTVQMAPPIPSVTAVAGKQSVRFQNLDALASGCRGVDVIHFEDDCTAVATDCIATPATDCTLTGGAHDSVLNHLADNLCYSAEFTVDQNFCGNEFTVEDARAHGLGRAIAKIEAALNIGILAKIDGFPPMTPAAGTFLDATLVNTYQVLLQSWAAADTPVTDMTIISENNNLQNFYLLSGNLLYADYLNALNSNAACCDPNALSMTVGPVDIFFDTRDLDATLATTAGDQAVLSIDPSSTIFWNHYDFASTPTSWGDSNATTVWRVQSPRLTYANGGVQVPVWYDVLMQTTCGVTGGKLHPVETYKVSFKGGFHETPTTCAVDPGAKIIHFTDDIGV